MGRFLLFAAVGTLLTAILLFFPIFLEVDIHYDMNRKKFGFALYAYKVLKLIGGYVTTYPGGIALHISPKKAILKPYSGMDSERKKFSFTRTVPHRFLFFDDGNGCGISHSRFARPYGPEDCFLCGGRTEGKSRKQFMADGRGRTSGFHESRRFFQPVYFALRPFEISEGEN